MSRKGAIEYISYAGAVGYGTAAVGYVRLLVEAGFEVHWMPYPGDAIGSGRVGDGIGDAELSRGRASLIARSVAGADSRLKPLVEATSRPVDARIRIIHLVPGHWLRAPQPHDAGCAISASAPGRPTRSSRDGFRRSPAWIISACRPRTTRRCCARRRSAFRPQRWFRISVARRCTRHRPRASPGWRNTSASARTTPCSTRSTPGPRANALRAHRRLRAQLHAGGPCRAHRQDQPRRPVRRSRVSGARPQRKPGRGGDHRPRRGRTRTAAAPHRASSPTTNCPTISSTDCIRWGIVLFHCRGPRVSGLAGSTRLRTAARSSRWIMAGRSTISAPIGAAACRTGWRLPRTLPDTTGSKMAIPGPSPTTRQLLR